MSGNGRSTVKGGECDCAPGTIMRTSTSVLKLGLGIRGNGRRGARAAEESTKRIHCRKECEIWVNRGSPERQAMTLYEPDGPGGGDVAL